MREMLLVFAVLVFAGCVHHDYYVNPNIAEHAFRLDENECAKSSTTSALRARWDSEGGAVRSGSSIDRAMFRSCMRTRGYSVASLDASESPPDGYFLSDFDH